MRDITKYTEQQPIEIVECQYTKSWPDWTLYVANGMIVLIALVIIAVGEAYPQMEWPTFVGFLLIGVVVGWVTARM